MRYEDAEQGPFNAPGARDRSHMCPLSNWPVPFVCGHSGATTGAVSWREENHVREGYVNHLVRRLTKAFTTHEHAVIRCSRCHIPAACTPIQAGSRIHAVQSTGLLIYGAVSTYRVSQSSCRLSSPELVQEDVYLPGAEIARSAACV